MKLTRTALLSLCAGILLTAQVPDRDLPAVAQAQAHFQTNARAYGLSDSGQELKARKSRRDERGAAHIRFDQYFRGVPVFEGEAIAHVSADGSVTVTDAIRKGLNLDVRAGINRPAAQAIAAKNLGIKGPFQVTKDSLEIVGAERAGADTLTYHFRFVVENEIDEPAQWDVFVDANTGRVALKFSSLETSAAVGTGLGMYVGQVSLNTDFTSGAYSLRDTTRAGSETRDMANKQSGSGAVVTDTANLFGDGSLANTDPDTAGADAHYGTAMTWDYYLNMFGRTGIDGNGRKSYNRVHYGRRYENAFWSDSCFCMTYGDGASTFYALVSLDVAGHEMSHGVMSMEANLTYSGESGGLNEANSDIFGALVEFYANNARDTGDYWIGEKIYRSNYSSGTYQQIKALRYMDDPSKDGRSPACWSSTLGSLDVHYSSGPANHMFYLLSNGGTSKCNGQSVSGIGRDKAARIWYDAITNRMTASTNYKGARTAALAAASALYGAGSAESSAVAAAFSAINVN